MYHQIPEARLMNRTVGVSLATVMQVTMAPQEQMALRMYVYELNGIRCSKMLL